MIVKEKIKKENLQTPFTKAVADIERGIMAVGCELHFDCAEELMQDGSASKNLWGFNIYPDKSLDFVSLINIRPAEHNRSMKIEDQEICRKIQAIADTFL